MATKQLGLAKRRGAGARKYIATLPDDLQWLGHQILMINDLRYIQAIRQLLLERSRTLATLAAERRTAANRCPSRTGNKPHLWTTYDLAQPTGEVLQVQACKLCRYVEFKTDIAEQQSG